MSEKFEVGDHVSWNSEAGRVSGTITKAHTEDFEYKGHHRRASEDEPQYEIKSDTTDHIAAHTRAALPKVSGRGPPEPAGQLRRSIRRQGDGRPTTTGTLTTGDTG